jgi:predicted TPR repeat methyltransferase
MTNPLSEAMLRQAGINNDPVQTAFSLLDQGNGQAALHMLEDLARRFPNKPDVWFGLGQVRARIGDPRAGAKAFRRVIQLAPDVADGYVHLGNTYMRLGRVSQAVDVYREGLARLPQDALLHFNLGVAIRQAGNIDDAIAEFQRAIALFADYAMAYFSLGNAYRDKQMPTEAVAAYRKAIGIEPRYAAAVINMAGVLAEQENYAEAIASCHRALALEPGNVHALRNLSLCLYRTGRFDEGATATTSALKAAPEDMMLHYTMGEMLYGMVREGKADQARPMAQWWRQTFPANATAQHMAAAVLGEKPPERAGDDYVRETFDRFAGQFEKVLTGLGYDVPERLSAAALAALPGRSDLAILDAGCGTGLCAPFLKPAARRLTGVDLSAGMLEKAQARALYDALHQAELGAFLGSTTERYDLAVAADVFCYFGALDEIFAALGAKTAPGGALAFTVEAIQGGETAPAEGYRLGPTGRYQHDAAYVKAALHKAGYSVARWDDTQGRVEMGQPVPCFMVLARRD